MLLPPPIRHKAHPIRYTIPPLIRHKIRMFPPLTIYKIRMRPPAIRYKIRMNGTFAPSSDERRQVASSTVAPIVAVIVAVDAAVAQYLL